MPKSFLLLRRRISIFFNRNVLGHYEGVDRALKQQVMVLGFGGSEFYMRGGQLFFSRFPSACWSRAEIGEGANPFGVQGSGFWGLTSKVKKHAAISKACERKPKANP